MPLLKKELILDQMNKTHTLAGASLLITGGTRSFGIFDNNLGRLKECRSCVSNSFNVKQELHGAVINNNLRRI